LGCMACVTACPSGVRYDVIRTEGALRAKLTAPPAALAEAVRGALTPLLASLRGGAAALYPALGIAYASGDPVEAAGTVHAVAAARAALSRLGGALVLSAAPAAVRLAADVWGPPPPALPLMRRLKDQLDPDHRLAPGRFVGGL
ncbi:MAG TPA: hypothetical protein VF904_20395, partial [Anaeromyxobacteraceae bacterium]